MLRLIFLILVVGVIADNVEYEDGTDWSWLDQARYVWLEKAVNAFDASETTNEDEVVGDGVVASSEVGSSGASPSVAAESSSAAGASSSPAASSSIYLDITNRTGYPVTQVFVSPTGSESWGSNLIPNQVIAEGDSIRIDSLGTLYPEYQGSLFDVRLVDSDGDSYSFGSIDITKFDIVATAENLDQRN